MLDMMIIKWPNILIALSFIAAAMVDIVTHQALLDYVRMHRIPLPKVAMWLGIGIKLVCAFGLLFYATVHFAAIGLILFIAAATIIFKNFWARPKEERAVCFAEFLTMIAVIGGISGLV